MAADALRVSVLFAAIDKLTGPLKSMGSSSKGLKADIAATKREVLSLQKAQGRAAAFRQAESDYRLLGDSVKVARLEHKAMRLEIAAADKVTASQTRKLEQLAAAERKAGAIYQEQGAKLQRLGNELEAAGVDVARLVEHEDRLDLQVYETNKRLEQQTQRLERLAKGIQRAEKITAIGDKMANAGTRMSIGMTLPAIALGKAAFDASRDAAELQSAFDQTFGKMSPMMNKWAVATGNAMGRSTQEMQGAANTFGLFFNQVAPDKKAAAMSQKFAGLAQDLGSFFNTDTQTAIDKLRSGLSGESEPLRDFGVFLNEAAVKAKLLEMKIKPVGKEFTDQQKILARYQLILEATKKAQGDVARTSAGAANQQRAAAAQYEEAKVAIGQHLLPVLTQLFQKASTLLAAFNALSPATQSMIVKAVAIAAALGPVLIVVGKVVSAIGTLRKAYLGLKLAQAGGTLFSLASMGPALIFVAIAAAIGVAAYLIWKHWDKIKAAFATAGQWIAAKFEQLKSTFMRFPGLFGPLGMAVAFVVRHWGQIKSAFGAGVAFLQALPSRMATIGSQIIQGLINGISGRLAALKNTVVGAASSAATWFKQKLGIRSPSRVFMQFGGHITEGLAQGIGRGEGAAVQRIARLAQQVSGAFAASSLVATPAIAAVAPIARPSLSSPSSAASAAARAPAPLGPIEIHIHQLPGQSSADLAQAVAAELRKLQATSTRSSYHDDD